MYTLKRVLLIIQHTPAPFMKCMAMTEVNRQFVGLLTKSSTHPPEGKETSVVRI